MNCSCMQRIAVFVLAIISLGVFVDRTQACVTHDPPPPNIWIQFHEDGSVWITFHGYQTFGAAAGGFCTCALNQVPLITAVNAAEFRDAGTGELIEEFSFTSNPNSDFGGGIPWAGFATAPLPVPIEAGTLVDILFDVDLVPGTTFDDLAAELAAGGNMIGTDEAGDDGSPAGTHQLIFPAGPIEPSNVIPTVSEWGLIIMTLLALTAGTIVFARRRRPAVA